MNYNRLAIIFIVVTAIFVMPLLNLAHDAAFADDTTVPGKPFKVLQDQIDDLQQQINNMPTGKVKAYSARSHYTNMPQSEDRIPVITLSLPEGKFIMTITMLATFFHEGIYNANYQTFVDCVCVDQYGAEIQGCGISGGVTGIETLAVTFEQPLFETTNVITLCCKHGSWSDDPMTINGLTWTAIKVDELDIQTEQ